MTFIGIDLGTSGLRALLVDELGKPLGSVERHYPVSHPHTGWSEQNPADWTVALDSAITALGIAYPKQLAQLKGIGVAGHMHGATLLDTNGKVLRPCILWNDTRSHLEAAQLDQTPLVRELSGNIVFPGFTAPKLAWVKHHEPNVFDKVAKVLLPAAYINYYLTGDYVADMSDSAGTSWLDTGKRDWSDALLAAGHMRRDQMPRLVEGSQAAGELRGELAKRWGLSDQVIVAGGAGDNAAAACGMGTLREGQGFISLGTSGVLLAARNGYKPDPATAVHTFCHAIPDRWYQMGVMLSATDSLNWLSRITNTKPEELTQPLGERLLPPSTTRFLPYLSGERTPHNDADIRGSFTGLSTSTDRNDMTRAVLEGVAFAFRDSLEALKSTGADIDTLMATGGGTRSRYWLKLIATVLDTSLTLPKDGEFGAALGAARLGIAAATGSEPSGLMLSPEIAETIEPERELSAQFEAAYRCYQDAYLKIKSAS